LQCALEFHEVISHAQWRSREGTSGGTRPKVQALEANQTFKKCVFQHSAEILGQNMLKSAYFLEKSWISVISKKGFH